MDSLEVVTYFIAALGVVVLGLCAVVAGILIYQYCRRNKRLSQYEQVEVEEAGNTEEKSYRRNPSPPAQQRQAGTHIL